MPPIEMPRAQIAHHRPGRISTLRTHFCIALGCAFLAAPGALFAADAPGLVTSEFIYETAPFPECHASTIAETSNGLIAAWFGGKHEKAPDVGIWVSRKESGAWTTPIQVANGVQHDAKRHPCWNPVLFQPKSGPLLLFYKVGPSPKTWWGMVVTSTDEGKTWSAPRRLPEDILGPIKNKPVQLADGTVLCGSSTEPGGGRVHFERFSLHDDTWSLVGPVNDSAVIDAIQPSILFHGGGSLQALGRTQQGKIFEIWSQDDGNSWGRMTLTDLPNPDSGIDATTLRDGRQALVYNHTTKHRSPLNLAISDDGKHWQAALVLENTPGFEFSYPAIIQTRDGLLHITYTWHRKRIRHAVVDPSKLELKPIQEGRWPQ